MPQLRVHGLVVEGIDVRIGLGETYVESIIEYETLHQSVILQLPNLLGQIMYNRVVSSPMPQHLVSHLSECKLSHKAVVKIVDNRIGSIIYRCIWSAGLKHEPPLLLHVVIHCL